MKVLYRIKTIDTNGNWWYFFDEGTIAVGWDRRIHKATAFTSVFVEIRRRLLATSWKFDTPASVFNGKPIAAYVLEKVS